MTVLLNKPAHDQVTGIPGSFVFADLTPPELSAARALKTLRRGLISGLVLVVAACAGGYVWAAHGDSAAQGGVDAATAQTSTLTAEQAKYAIVTQVQSQTSELDGQLGTLFVDDVDVASVLKQMQAAAPKGVSISSLVISVATGSDGAPSTLDPTLTQVGTVTMSGTATQLDEVPAYAGALGQLRGVADVIPATNTAAETGTSTKWTITAELTSLLLTHRYAPVTTSTTTTSTSTGGH